MAFSRNIFFLLEGSTRVAFYHRSILQFCLTFLSNVCYPSLLERNKKHCLINNKALNGLCSVVKHTGSGQSTKEACFNASQEQVYRNQTSWEMKIFNPPSNFACSQALRGMHKNALVKGRTHSCCHGNNGCLFEAQGLIFIQKRRKKRVKCLFLYLKLNTLQIGTSTIHTDIIRLHIDTFNFPWE